MVRAEKFWDRVAANYDQEEKKDEKDNLAAIEKFRSYLKPGDYVLDYACGTGTMAISLARSVKRILAIDTSGNMLAVARKKTVAQGTGNITYLQATIDDDRLNTTPFDVVTASAILHLLDDPAFAVNRAHSLLKPEGLFISITPCVGEMKKRSLRLKIAGMLGLIPRINPLTNRMLQDIITGAGFNIIEAEAMPPNSPIYFIAAKRK